MVYVVTINNKKYEVEVEKGQAAIVGTKEVSSHTVVPHVLPTIAPAPQAAPVAVNPGKGEVVKAPMPGTILEIKVNAGSRVKKGDLLFILEAMKMENEIMASTDGIVAQIQAVKGSTVNTGDLLAVIQQ